MKILNFCRMLFKVADNARVWRVLMRYTWLYVFGFATHILSFKVQKPIGKTDICNVLAAGGFNPLPQLRGTKKIK